MSANQPGQAVDLQSSPRNWAAIIALSILIGATAVWAWVLGALPPTAKDALIHHLAVPKLWLQAGGIVDIPWLTFSYYPMNLELLFMIPLALGVDVGAHYIHHLFGLLTGLLLFLHVRRRIGPEWGLCAALLFLSLPSVLRLSVSAYVDLGLTFFVTASALALIHWRETDRKVFFFLSAAAFGLALGTKYNSLIGLPIFCLAVFRLSYDPKRGLVPAVLQTILWLLPVLIVYSPWLIRNALLTGNPTYPLFNGFWGLPGLISADLNMNHFALRRHFFGETPLEIILIPVRAFFEGQDFTPEFFDGVLNPALFFLPWPALAAARFPESRPLTLGAVLWILLVFLETAFIIRYILPVIGLLTIVSVYGLKEIKLFFDGRLNRRVSGFLLTGIMVLILAPNVLWATDYWKKTDPGPYLFGQETRQEYLRKRLGVQPALEFINKNLPDRARVLFLYAGSRGYYCDRDYFYYPHYSGEILRPILEKARSTEDVAQGLKKLGADHVLVNQALLNQYLKGVWPPEKVALWDGFTRTGWRKLFSARGYTVYELK